MFARNCTRWVGAILIALTIGLWSMPAANASPAQAVCPGCLASSGPLPTFFSTGTSCGIPVGLRLGITNFDGNCVASTTGTCVPGDPCKFVVSLFYISNCQATVAGGSTCGPIALPAFLPPTAVWALVTTYTQSIPCGRFCDVRFSIRCVNCTMFGASVGGRMKCSDCP